MTTVHLVLHGETIWHVDNRYAGSSDIALTPKGIEQAEALAMWAKAFRPDVVVSSNQQRALDTAAPAVDALGLTLRVDARLRELDFGLAEGMTQEEMRAKFSSRLTEFLNAPADNPLPGGESPRTAVYRLRTAFDELCREHCGQHLLIVMHSTAMRLLLCDLFGLDLNAYRTTFPAVGNGALTTVRVQGQRSSLLRFNSELSLTGT